jgi:hypothetical protein
MCYVHCSSCRQRIKEPFSRLSGPVVHVHRYDRLRPPCRVIVIPAASGDAHRVVVVPREVRLEDALERELARRVA